MEVTMHALQIRKVIGLGLDRHCGIIWAAVLGRLGAFDIAMLRHSAQAKPDAVPNYEGHAWCDSLERQVNSDIATCRRARF
jgi:hypothetical protein